MKQIDLKPDQYASQDRKGRWIRKSDPRKSGLWFGFSVLFLGFVWWQAGPEVNSLVMFSAVIAFAGGLVCADWLRDIY